MEISEVKKLAEMLMFKLSDEEAQEIIEEFKTFDRQQALLDKIDTEAVEEMIFPFDVKTSFLRDDEADHILSQDDVLKNVAKTKQGHVVVPKVVR